MDSHIEDRDIGIGFFEICFEDSERREEVDSSRVPPERIYDEERREGNSRSAWRCI